MIKKLDSPEMVMKVFVLMLNSESREQNFSRHAWIPYLALVTVDQVYREDCSSLPIPTWRNKDTGICPSPSLSPAGSWLL